MKKLFVLFLIGFFMVGCATVQLPTVCDKAPPESIVCPKLAEIGVQIEDIEILIQIVFERFVEKEDKIIVKEYCNIISNMLKTSSADMIFLYWTDITDDLTSSELLLLNRYLSVLNVDQVLCEFDQQIIERILLKICY